MLKANQVSRREGFVKGLSFHGFHRIVYHEWGEAENDQTLVCVHGVSRNGRDFDFIAEKMAQQYRVICPDVVGRGKSDHLVDPDGYDYLQYNADMNVLLARVGQPKVDWLGTSMGGLIGMVFASMSQTPIRRLILNDIGPFISRDSLTPIGQYIGRAGEFRSKEKLKEYMKEIYSEFKPMSEDDWDHLLEHSAVRTRTGKYKLRMDPGVGDSFRDRISLFDVDMWDIWDQIHCPVLILRGKESSFFARETAEEMMARGPESTLVEFDEAGHTPTLRSDAEVKVIADWLDATAP